MHPLRRQGSFGCGAAGSDTENRHKESDSAAACPVFSVPEREESSEPGKYAAGGDEIPGIGQVKAAQLKCIAELAERIAKTSRLRDVRLNEPASVAGYYMESLRHKTKENLLLAMFDAKSHLLGEETISVGTVTNSLVSPREIFMIAMEYRAAHIVLLHNHPSGDPTPSEADLAVTRRVAEGGRILEIVLADHIIIGDNRYISFRENGLLG